jgi:hypothetical protein
MPMPHAVHNTVEVAEFIVELTQRTPIKDRTVEMYVVAVQQKFPGLDDDQLLAAQEIASATLKATGRLRPQD